MGRLSTIKKYFFIVVVISFFFSACSESHNYYVAIRAIDSELTMCYIELDIKASGRERPQILITLDNPPSNAADGILTELTSFAFEIPVAGLHKVYVTLVQGKRFLTSPISSEVIIDLTLPYPPEINWSMSSGRLHLELYSDGSSNIHGYRLIVDSTEEFFSSSGSFAIDINKGQEYFIQGYALRGNIHSEPKMIDLLLSEDKPPEIEIALQRPYEGGAIGLTVKDDWDRPEALEVRAFTQEHGISLLYDSQRLIPEVPLLEATNTVVIVVTDSSNNTTVKNEVVNVVKKTAEKPPELFIEEGTVRSAKWEAIDGRVILQKFKGGEWIEISSHDSGIRSSTIPRESLSPEGDIYRLIVEASSEIFLPSIPVFAKESFFRRFSTEFISSLMGMDALLVGGNDYRLYGNIAVRENTVMKVEPGAAITISRSNTLLVGGVLDLEGRRERVKVNPGGSTGTIEISNNGVLIARNVDFSNTRIIARDAALVIMENCTSSAGIEVRGARTVQIYNSEIAGNVLIENVRELYVHSSVFNLDSLKISSSSSAMISQSAIAGVDFDMRNSKLRLVLGKLDFDSVQIRQLSRLSIIDTLVSIGRLVVQEASSVNLEIMEFVDTPDIVVSTLSRLSMYSETARKTPIKLDAKSTLATY